MQIHSAVILLVALMAKLGPISGTSTNQPGQETASADPLAALVGEWQTDTVMNVSARSSCVWTPHHGGVLCEQTISSPSGTNTALDLFAVDSAAGAFVLYVVGHPGAVLNPVPLSIHGAMWTYGGTNAESDGKFYRTVNDFSNSDEYVWRQESSANGKEWTAGIHGRVRRVR